MPQTIECLLGEIKGKQELMIAGQDEMHRKLDAFNARIGKVETTAAKHGMVTGVVAALGISLIKEKLGL